MSIYDVNPNELIEKVAEELKKIEEMAAGPLPTETLLKIAAIRGLNAYRRDNVDDAINEGAREYFFHIMQATFNNPCSGCPGTKENCKAYLT